MEGGTLDRIFTGSLEQLPPLGSKIVRIFTSSTFTDMSLERNTLMEQVYPRIKEYCREKHGLEFQVVDMRWGVRDEATDDHMTTELCMKEIKNCQRLSMGPNFVVFLGQKYGYRPIPTYIDGEEFVKFRGMLKEKRVDVSILDLWYKEDTNSVPSVYVLQPISSILNNFNNKKDPKLQAKDQATWWDTLGKLQILLRRAAQSLFAVKKIDEDTMHNYMMSVTEREVINGILKVPNTRSTCLAYVRQINNINMNYVREACKFVDMAGRVVDVEAQNLLGDLRDRRLPAKMKKPNYIKFEVEWEGREGLNAEVHHDYLVQFTHHFFKNIKKLVDKAMQKAYLTQQSTVVTEILQHLHMCNDVVKVFQGRVKELQKIQEYIQGSSRTPLVLHGIGGCGKTSLLAKAASLVTSWIKSKAILVLRFIGTTPDSSTLLPLLTTVCQQIAYNYNLPWQEMPGEIIPLVAHLKNLLFHATAEYPLFIFIDSLDQLSGSNNAVKVTWLPIVLPPNVKMVITADSDEGSPPFPILQKIYEENTTFIEVKPLHPDLANRILKMWLTENNRKLKDLQWKLVKSAILKCSLPIFVKLVFAEVCRWKSYTPEKDMTLTTTVVESIMHFIEKVEKQHGRILVSHAFAYITASKSGLSEIELEDLISLDDIVLEDVYQYHLPPVRRIPPLLWTRIRNDIPSYLSEREADGITVLNWYHRQFRNAAMARYLDNDSSLRFFHSSIADYFLGTWGGGKKKPFKYSELQRMRFAICASEGEADRKVPLQPLVFESTEDHKGKSMNGVRYNMRKMSELPFHLIRAHRRTDLFSEVLFNYGWLYYKLCSFPISAVLADFEDAKENLSDKEKNTLRELTLVADSLRLGRSVLIDYPQMVGPQITGRLLPVKENYKNIKSLINQCDQVGTKYCGLVPAYHCLHTPGGPMKYSLEGHPFAVFDFCFTSDYRYVISVSNRFIICDVTTSDITQDIDPQIEGIMMDVQRTDDDKYAIAYTNYNLILLLNILSGDVQKVTLRNREKEGFLTGIGVGPSVFCTWSDIRYFFFKTSTGDILEEHIIQEKNASILSIYINTLRDYHIIINLMHASTGQCRQLLKSMKGGNEVSSLIIDGALSFNVDRSKVFVVERDKETTEIYSISLYAKSNDLWSFQETVVKNVPQILSLSFDDEQGLLSGILTAKFMIWQLQNGTEISYCLPDTVRNISMKPLQSQSSMVVTQNNQFVVGAVRKQLYIWAMRNGQMLRVLDAHFGRILRMRTLKLEDFNGFVTASLDRSLKVWNVRNLFEDSHVIDRMDMPIEKVCMDRKSTLAVTMTRSSIGVWDLMTGKLIARLSDSQVGAIISHALITADGRFIPCVESGLYIVWSVENRSVLCREKEANVKNVSLISRDTRALILSTEGDHEAQINCRSVPDGGVVFSLSFPVTILRDPVVTANGKFLVISTFDKGQECLSMYNPRKGKYLHKFPLSKDEVKSFKYLVPMPSTLPLIGLLEDYKAVVVDVSSKKILKTIIRWNGVFSRNGKLGLYATGEGGLDILELRRGKPVKTLLTPVAEGIFSVKAFFSANNKYVIYYHSGRNSIRIFRVLDGRMIANYRLSAEIHAVEGTPDGLGVVVGGVDGTLTLLSIVDTDVPETMTSLSELPSRMEAGEGNGNISVTFKSAARQIMNLSFPPK